MPVILEFYFNSCKSSSFLYHYNVKHLKVKESGINSLVWALPGRKWQRRKISWLWRCCSHCNADWYWSSEPQWWYFSLFRCWPSAKCWLASPCPRRGRTFWRASVARWRSRNRNWTRCRRCRPWSSWIDPTWRWASPMRPLPRRCTCRCCSRHATKRPPVVAPTASFASSSGTTGSLYPLVTPSLHGTLNPKFSTKLE